MKIIFHIIILLLVSNIYAQDKVSFFGHILNQYTSEPIKNATVRITPPGYLAETDTKGRFSFVNVPMTNITVKIIKYGYDMTIVKIRLTEKENKKMIYIAPAQEMYLDEVVVRTKKRKIEGSKNVLRSKQIKNPSSFIFNDAMNALKKLPGVSGDQFSGLLYIRGGGPFENLSLMDDVVILFPYHWGGGVSIFNPDMVDRIDFYTGGFPAVYGNATSGIVDVKIKNGNFNRFKGYLDLNFTGGTLLLESPLKLSDKTSFIMAAQRTHYDLLLNLFAAQKGTKYPYYDQIHFKLYSQLNSKHSLTYYIFYSSDGMRWEFDEEQAEESSAIQPGDYFEYYNRNLINSVQWQYSITSKVNIRNTLSYFYQEGEHEFTGSESPSEGTQKGYNWQYRNDWDYSMNKYNSISFGYLYFGFNGDIDIDGYSKETKITGEVETNRRDFQYDGSINYHALYIQDELELVKDDFIISAGVRYEKSDLGKEDLISPRTGLRKKLIKNMYFNSAWGYYYRYTTDIRQIDEREGNPDLKAEKSTHYIAGVENHIANDYMFKNDFFYKDYKNLIIDDPVKNYINGMVGYAYGFESLLQKKETGRFDGWISYTYAVTKRKIRERSEPFDPYNDGSLEVGQWFYPGFDQRHTISVVGNYKISDSWSVYTSWDFHTGQPYTDITGAQKVVNKEGVVKYLPEYGPYNLERYPSYHRLDVKFTYGFLFLNNDSEIYFEFINVYFHKNIDSISWNEEYTEKKETSLFPFLIIGGWKVNF